jgi:Mg-chelatase subunit ChlD
LKVRPLICMWLLLAGLPIAQEAPPAVFKSGVERVAIAATVRDSKGRLVTTLKARDFELLDDGKVRPLVGVWSEPSPASVAILLDASGSMSTKMARARETAELRVGGLKPGVD